MRWALLIVACGCQQGMPAQPPPPPAPPIPAKTQAKLVLADAVVADAAAAPDVLAQLAADEFPAQICFAVSANGRRVACAFQSDDWQNELDGRRGVTILGDVGDARGEWTYLDTTDKHIIRDHAREAIDPAVLADVRASLASRHYVAFSAPRTPLVASALIDGKTLRRHRVITSPAAVWDPKTDPQGIGGSWNTYEDRVSVECSDTEAPIALEQLNIRYGDVAMTVSKFDERRVLLEVEGHWGIEGESGTTLGAQLIDVYALCQR